MRKISKNIKHTEEIAKDFLKYLLTKKNKNACVVGLSGDLGAGKTAFTQAVAKNLGIKMRVNSPTFVIMKKYPIKSEKHKFLFHLDAYRLKNEKELVHIRWEEIIANPKHLVFIEWPENIIKSMPKKYHKVLISHTKEGHRSFKIK